MAAFMVSCSAKIEPYYVEYVCEIRNSSGVNVRLFMQNQSPFPEGMVLQNDESVQWRTNSGVYAWPFNNVDSIANTVVYNDNIVKEYGTGKGMTVARNPGDPSNYVKKKIDDFTYSLVYTFVESDYASPQK